MTPSRWWDATTQDLRYTLRGLRASPVMTISIVLTLGLGIGAVATMYGLVSWLLLRPPAHVTEPDRVRRLFFQKVEPGAPPFMAATWLACVNDRLRNEAATIEHAAAYENFDVSVGSGADAARVRAAAVSASFWPTLGTHAAIGRVFLEEEAKPGGGARVAILGDAFWRQRFAADPGAIGRMLRIRGESFEIIGVMPRGFSGIERQNVDLWLPLSAYPLSGRRWERDTVLSHIVRLGPGVSTAQADADLSRTLSDVVDEDAGCDRRPAAAPLTRLSVTAGPLARGLDDDMQLMPEARVAVWLTGVAIALLGVACANVTSLLLLRALRRRREIALRIALGMNRRRLAAQVFIESAVLALAAGVAAIVVVWWGGAWLEHVLLPNLGLETASPMFPSSIGAIAACVATTTLLAGTAIVLQAPTDPHAARQDGAARTTSRRGALHRALLIAQTAISVVLLTGAGLFLRSLDNIRTLDLGLHPDHVLVTTIDFGGTGRSGREIAAFYERALERVQGMPGVERASLAVSIPLRSARAGSIRPAGRAEPLAGPGGDATYVNDVTPGFFATTGTRILEGRDFLPVERGEAQVVIVNEAIARAGWPGRSPIGECVEIEDGGACATVIGVVENARRFFLKEPVSLLFYRPLPLDADDGGRGLFFRVAPGDRNTGAAARRAIQALETGLPFVRMQTLREALDAQTRPWRLGASIFTVFGALAILLAAVGLYAALSYTVTQRTREIGVRVAVGARALDVAGLIVGDGLGVVLAGVAAGMAIDLAGGPWIARLLFDVSPRDPVVFAVVGASLVAAALLAAVIPSRRAIRVDPVVALRAD